MIIDKITKKLLKLNIDYIDSKRIEKIQDTLNGLVGAYASNIEILVTELFKKTKRSEVLIFVATSICLHKITIDRDEINSESVALKAFQSVNTIKSKDNDEINSKLIFDHHTISLNYKETDVDFLLFFELLAKYSRALNKKKLTNLQKEDFYDNRVST